MAGACSKGVAGKASHGQNLFGLKAVQNDLVKVHGFWRIF